MKHYVIGILVLTLLFLTGCQTESIQILEKPGEIVIDDNQITLSPVENATTYRLNINGETIEITSLVYTFDQSGIYRIKYQARADGYVSSAYSDVYTVIIEAQTSKSQFTYSIHSEFDLLLSTTEFDVTSYTLYDDNEQEIDNQYMYMDGQHIYFKNEYLISLSVQEEPYLFKLETNRSTHDISIAIKDLSTPYVYTDYAVTIGNDAFVFGFELFHFELINLALNVETAFSTDDYSMDEGILTISQVPFVDAFNQDANLERVIVTYTLKNMESDAVKIGFLQVYRNGE